MISLAGGTRLKPQGGGGSSIFGLPISNTTIADGTTRYAGPSGVTSSTVESVAQAEVGVDFTLLEVLIFARTNGLSNDVTVNLRRNGAFVVQLGVIPGVIDNTPYTFSDINENFAKDDAITLEFVAPLGGTTLAFDGYFRCQVNE